MTSAGRDERAAFADRLAVALCAAGHLPTAAAIHTALVQRDEVGVVTIHAVRKWLGGDAIPQQATLRALAEWLRVPVGWLRFGETDHAVAPAHFNPDDETDRLLIDVLCRLNERDRHLLEDLIILLRSHSGTRRPPRRG